MFTRRAELEARSFPTAPVLVGTVPWSSGPRTHFIDSGCARRRVYWQFFVAGLWHQGSSLRETRSAAESVRH